MLAGSSALGQGLLARPVSALGRGLPAMALGSCKRVSSLTDTEDEGTLCPGPRCPLYRGVEKGVAPLQLPSLASVQDPPVCGLLAHVLLVPAEAVVRGFGVEAQDLSLLVDAEGERGN